MTDTTAIATPETMDELDEQVTTLAVDTAVGDLQALVPWKIVPPSQYGNDYEQRRAIESYFDDRGCYPRQYRSYTKEEWQCIINVLAETVHNLPKTDADYQHLTGLYVEEQTDSFLFLRSKRWNLTIQIPTKANASNRIALNTRDNWGRTESQMQMFIDFLLIHVPAEHRDTVLDVLCQYLQEIRVLVNRVTWIAENPDLAHLLEEKRR